MITQLRVNSYGKRNFLSALSMIDTSIVEYKEVPTQSVTHTILCLYSEPTDGTIAITNDSGDSLASVLFEWVLEAAKRNGEAFGDQDVRWRIETHDPSYHKVQGINVGKGCCVTIEQG